MTMWACHAFVPPDQFSFDSLKEDINGGIALAINLAHIDTLKPVLTQHLPIIM